MDNNQKTVPEQPATISTKSLRNNNDGREHIPRYPRGYVAVPTLQLIFAIVVLGLSAYIINEHPTLGGPPPGFGLSIFTSVVTISTVVYYFTSYCKYASAYNYSALLGLDIFNLIFWAISFAFVAHATGDLHKLGSLASLTDKGKKIYGAEVAIAVFGAFCFALFIVSVAIDGTILHRHRAAGGHSEAAMVNTSTGQNGAPWTAQSLRQQTNEPPTPMRDILNLEQSLHQQREDQQQRYEQQPQELQPVTGSHSPPNGTLPLQNEYLMSQPTGSSYYGGCGEQSPMGTGTYYQFKQQSYPEMNPHDQQQIPHNIDPEYEGRFGSQQQPPTEEYQRHDYSPTHGMEQPACRRSSPQQQQQSHHKHRELAELS